MPLRQPPSMPSRMDNALYGIPKAVETLVLIYNKDLIDKPLDSLQAWLDYSKPSAKAEQIRPARQV